MRIKSVTVELENGLRLQVGPGERNALAGLTTIDADLLGKIATPETLAEMFKRIADDGIAFLKQRQWR